MPGIDLLRYCALARYSPRRTRPVIQEYLDTTEPRIGKGKKSTEVKSNITDNESAKMKTSKGTIQGYNGVATVDQKHQIIIDAQAFGEGTEHHLLKPITETIQERLNRKVLLQVKEDKSLVGGAVLKLGTLTLDGSLKNLMYEEGLVLKEQIENS